MTQNKDKTYKVYESNKQLKVTLPRVLANSIGIRNGDTIKFIIERGEIIIRKAL